MIHTRINSGLTCHQIAGRDASSYIKNIVHMCVSGMHLPQSRLSYQACAYLNISGSPGWTFSYLMNNLV